ncbi:MAG: acyltransferase family protein, partial [Hyphomicrobium sp.]
MPTRMHNIDALRAIAALTVLFQHVSGDIWRAFPASLPYLKPVALDLFDWGRFGVVLFFLISGYVIPLSFTGPSPLQKFVISRIFRLYPAFWLSIVAMVGALHLNGVNLLPTQIAANVTMAYPLFGQAAINGVFWTLIIEVMFYIACFILFAAGQLESPKVVGALALLGIMSVVGPSVILGRQTLPLHGYFLSFLLLGSLIRQTHARLPHAKQLACLVAFAIIAALPIVSSLNAGRPTAFSYSTDMGVALSIIAAGALFIASWSPVFSSLPRFLLELGAWSF